MQEEDISARLEHAVALLESANGAIAWMTERMEQMERRLEALSPSAPAWLDSSQAEDYFGWSRRTMLRWRQTPAWDDGSYPWQEGLHWCRENGTVIYNRLLLEDWRINRLDLAAHQKTIEAWAKAQRQRLKAG